MKEQTPTDIVYLMVERYDEDGVKQMSEAEYIEYQATLDRLKEEGLESRNGLLLFNEATREPYGYEIQRKEAEVAQVVDWLGEELEPFVPDPELEGLSLADKIRRRAGI